MPLLEIEDLRKRFGGVDALVGASLSVAPGEVHVLIGSNGCGKSTLCKIVAGAVSPDAGVMRLDGTEVRFESPSAAARAGIGMFYQESSVIPQLSVADNVLLGREPRHLRFFVNSRVLRQRVEGLMQRFAAAAGEVRLDTPAADLAADQRQIVEIVKLLAREPRLIIFDEATASLDARQVAAFFDVIRDLKRQGRAIVFISHRMDEIFSIGDRVTVMRNGASVATLEISSTTREEILAHMLGERAPAAAAARVQRSAAAESLLQVEGLSSARLHDIRFELRAGEILGLGGLHGQGQSALLQTLFGAQRAQSGSVILHGRNVDVRRPADAVRLGIAYVSGDRTRAGALRIRPIFENLVLAALAQQRSGWIDRSRFLQKVAPILERLKLRFDGFDAPITELSGGNQQKVLIGRWLATSPRVLLLDDPSKGIDIEAKRDLFALIGQLAATGVGVILFSSEDEELLANADRILVFNGGRIVRELSRDTLTAHDLYHAAYRMEEAS